jgi:hypothetical protein
MMWPGLDLTDERIEKVDEGFNFHTQLGLVELRYTGQEPQPWRVVAGPPLLLGLRFAEPGDASVQLLYPARGLTHHNP